MRLSDQTTSYGSDGFEHDQTAPHAGQRGYDESPMSKLGSSAASRKSVSDQLERVRDQRRELTVGASAAARAEFPPGARVRHPQFGEGVVIAYNWIVDGSWVPINYDLDDIVLISSIAPVDFQGPGITEPNGVSYSLWTGGSDSDVNGCASCDLCQTFHMHDRATAWRQSISLHGVGHGDFHNGNASPFATGPCLVGRADTHKIVKGYLLPLVKHYVEANVPARDFLWRQWESFRPIGAPVNGCVTVDLMFREDPEENVVIDDYQTQPAPGTSSSGGPVTFSVTGVSGMTKTSTLAAPAQPISSTTLKS